MLFGLIRIQSRSPSIYGYFVRHARLLHTNHNNFAFTTPHAYELFHTNLIMSLPRAVVLTARRAGAQNLRRGLLSRPTTACNTLPGNSRSYSDVTPETSPAVVDPKQGDGRPVSEVRKVYLRR